MTDKSNFPSGRLESVSPPGLNVSLGKGLKMVVLVIIASVRVIGKMSALTNPGQMLGWLSLVLWLHHWVFLGLRRSPKLWLVGQIIQHSLLELVFIPGTDRTISMTILRDMGVLLFCARGNLAF